MSGGGLVVWLLGLGSTAVSDRLLRRSHLVAVGATSAGVRLLWVLATHRQPEGVSDILIYHRAAEFIANGQGYRSFFGHPTAYYPPGYPYFLGFLQWVANLLGHHQWLAPLAGIAQSALWGVAAMAVTWTVWCARHRLGADRAVPAAVAAGLSLALWPNLVFYAGALLSESLFVACFAVFVAALCHWTVSDAPPRWVVVLAAASLGAATLVRPQVLIVLPAWLAARWFCRADRRGVLRQGVVLLVGVVAAITPWTIRNAVVLDAFVPLSNNSGDNLCIGFHRNATGHFEAPPECETGEFYTDGVGAELRRNRETTRRAIRWAARNVTSLPVLSVRKMWFTYSTDGDGLRAAEGYEQDRFLSDGARSVLQWLSRIGYGLVMGAAAIGAVQVLRGWSTKPQRDLALGWITMTVASGCIVMLFFGDGRFKVATTPLFAALAGVGWASVRYRPRQVTEESA